MARIYANENFPFLVVAELRRLGHDVVTVAETGKANRATPDAEILEFAISTDRAILTIETQALHCTARQEPIPRRYGSVYGRCRLRRPGTANPLSSRSACRPVRPTGPCESAASLTARYASSPICVSLYRSAFRVSPSMRAAWLLLPSARRNASRMSSCS